MTRAYAYLRVSGKGQENGLGFDRQREVIEEFGETAGYEIEKFFQDVYTGTVDAVERPAFAEMVGATNGIQTVIVERLDRLARSVVAQEHTVLWLAAHDITLMVADTGENVTESYKSDPMKKALVQMQAVFSELEKSMIVKKLRVAREKMREETGRCEGRKPYGHTDPKEKAAIKRIKNLRHKRKGLKKPGPTQVARVLQAEGYPTKDGGPWTHQTVGNIIKRMQRRGRPPGSGKG